MGGHNEMSFVYVGVEVRSGDNALGKVGMVFVYNPM